MALTEQEQINIDNGLTTDGRELCNDRDHCPCGCGSHYGCFFEDEDYWERQRADFYASTGTYGKY